MSTLGGSTALLSLSGALNSTDPVRGTGHLILDQLPASPNDAFYSVVFTGTDTDFTLQVVENGGFAYGPHSHFSSLNLTFQYKKDEGISTTGTVALNLHKELFANGKVLMLTAAWNKENEALAFTASDSIEMEEIGKLSQVRVELGPRPDRWAGVRGLYTFDGGLGANSPSDSEEFATHDISGHGAPSLYFEGKADFTMTGNERYKARWTDKGIAFEGDGVLANQSDISNTVIDSIQQSESFSVEIWIKPGQTLQEGPAQIFAIESGQNPKRNFFLLGQGPWTDGKYKKNPDAPAGAYLNATYGQPVIAVPSLKDPYWEKPFMSPANSLDGALKHVVYTYDQKGTTHCIYINGVPVAEKYNPGDNNNWLGKLHIAVGNDIKKNKPWKGEIQQLAIFNRALTAEEVSLHYSPQIKISGNFSLDHVIPPLKDEVFPFNLNIGRQACSLVAAREVDIDIKPGLGFRHILLECLKLPDPDSPWSFSGKFHTRFWEAVVGLNARFDAGTGRLNLSSPGRQPEHKLGIVELRIGEQDAWELSFGEHQEFAVIPLVLDHAMPGYREFRLGSPKLVLTDTISMKGKWLGEQMAFVSQGKGTKQFLKGSAAFSLPFTLNLPPTVDPETGDTWGDTILLENVNMQISIDVEIQKDGFLGVVRAGFDYKGQPVTLPERRIYTPPVSKMALLGDLIDEIKVQADTLFAGHRKHEADYYADMNAVGKPYIHLSASGAAETVIKATLPRIFTTNPSPGYKSPATDPIFELSQTAAACKLKLNLSGGDAPGIRTAFDDLMKQVEGQKGLSSGGLRLLQSRIAERLPLEFESLLYYHYGWDVGKNYIDLQPGMRLRVDFQNYQFVHATEQKAKKGFVGGGSITIPINSYTGDDGAQYLGFGPFVSRLRGNNQGNISGEGAGGLFDLVKTGIRKPFFRLFFPSEAISAAKPVDPPRIEAAKEAAVPERAVTIVGADRWQDLPVEIPVTTTGNLVSFFFRDKAMVIPEIQVFVGNREVYVPVGTTVRQLIEKYMNIPLPAASQPNLRAFLGKARPRRLIHTGPDSAPAYRFLNFSTDSVQQNRDLFDLPLIKGDKFYF